MPVSRETFETYLKEDEMKVKRMQRVRRTELEDTQKVLALLKDHAMTIKEISDALVWDRNTVCKQLSSMLQRQLIDRRYDPVNLQSHWIARR